MYNDRNLEHPVITQIERNGYPDAYPDEPNPDCAWCGMHFRDGDNTFTFCGEEVCEPCFKQWLKDQLITDIADAMHIPHETYYSNK